VTHNRRRAQGRSMVEPWFACIGLVVAALVSPPGDVHAQDLRAQNLRAQDFPNRTVRIVVPFPAGGTADVMPRIVGDRLARKWGQAVVIENKPGAAGNIGAEAVYHADPDGYTLLATPQPPLVINHTLYPKLGFDPQEFEPVIILARVPSALVANPRIKADTIPDFIAAARANPGRITAATQGSGTTSHLTSELFQMTAQVTFQQVPYRGSAPALAGLLAGDVDVMFDNLGVSLALVKGGQLKLIAVATPQRMTSLPNVPTIAETLPGFASSAWFSVVAPPKTPATIVAAINAGLNEALRQSDIVQRLLDLSAEPIGGSPQAMAAYMREEVDRWGKVIRTVGVKLP
jgi:tripartite-type tricarboxylate transporter receptor subunit TctC